MSAHRHPATNPTAAWDALDAILPPLPGEPDTISALEAIQFAFVDELPPNERDLVLALDPLDLLGLDGIGIWPRTR